jgi:hypothetical protein
MAKNHRNCPSPPYRDVTVAAEDLEVEEVLELEAVVEGVVLVTVGVLPVPVAAIVEETWRPDSNGSDVNCAVRPVTFEQTDGMVVAVPETKLTAAHYKKVSALNKRLIALSAYLVENSIWCILNNTNNTF